MSDDANARTPATADGRLSVQQGEVDMALTKQAGASTERLARVSTPKNKGGGGGSGGGVDGSANVTVQFSVLFDGDEEKFAHLWAMRDCMHRILNTAISEWHRADKVASSRNPNNIVLERGPVTQSVQDLLNRNRIYWADRLQTEEAHVQKIRVDLGRAKSKGLPTTDVTKAENELKRAQSSVLRARVKANIRLPSSVYDTAVQFTKTRLDAYRKESFLGTRSLDSFRDGQPIRWRDGSWTFTPSEKKGRYVLGLELHKSGERSSDRVVRGKFQVIPDGPSMHAFAKKMSDPEAVERGDVKLCDARIVYSERKKQWFAKLCIRYRRAEPESPGSRVAAMRRGVHNAFVIAFDDGRVEYITGTDVIHFKRQIKAEKESRGRHMGSLELGAAARGHGKRRRTQALRIIGDRESRFVDARSKTWAANIARSMVERRVGLLLIPKIGTAEMRDGDDHVEAFLRQWPFARSIAAVKQALDRVGVKTKAYVPHFDARRCPNELGNGKRCGHINAPSSTSPVYQERRVQRVDPRNGNLIVEIIREQVSATFLCEVCGFKRPSDQIVAMNALWSEIGPRAIVQNKKSHAEFLKTATDLLGEEGVEP